LGIERGVISHVVAENDSEVKRLTSPAFADEKTIDGVIDAVPGEVLNLGS
jgi:hypothetical protein